MLQEMKSDNSRPADCNDLERMAGSWRVPSSVSARTSYIVEKYLSWPTAANVSLKADPPKERPLHHAGHQAGAGTPLGPARPPGPHCLGQSPGLMGVTLVTHN